MNATLWQIEPGVSVCSESENLPGVSLNRNITALKMTDLNTTLIDALDK